MWAASLSTSLWWVGEGVQEGRLEVEAQFVGSILYAASSADTMCCVGGGF